MARRFVGWWPTAFVGGLAYGFSPFTATTANAHLFLLFQAVPPLVILCVDRFFRSDNSSPVRTGVALGLCFVVQFYVSTEAFASLAVMTCIAVVLGVKRWSSGSTSPSIAGAPLRSSDALPW